MNFRLLLTVLIRTISTVKADLSILSFTEDSFVKIKKQRQNNFQNAPMLISTSVGEVKVRLRILLNPRSLTPHQNIFLSLHCLCYDF